MQRNHQSFTGASHTLEFPQGREQLNGEEISISINGYVEWEFIRSPLHADRKWNDAPLSAPVS